MVSRVIQLNSIPYTQSEWCSMLTGALTVSHTVRDGDAGTEGREHVGERE